MSYVSPYDKRLKRQDEAESQLLLQAQYKPGQTASLNNRLVRVVYPLVREGLIFYLIERKGVKPGLERFKQFAFISEAQLQYV